MEDEKRAKKVGNERRRVKNERRRVKESSKVKNGRRKGANKGGERRVGRDAHKASVFKTRTSSV